MLIGVPKEIKTHEYRVGLTPASVKTLKNLGHEVFVENNAGIGIGFSNEEYEQQGAKILQSAKEVFSEANLIIKVKEPQPIECKMLNDSHTLFTFLHLAADKEQTNLLMKSKCNAIAYETVTDNNNRLPLLAPMSEVAGKVSVQVGAHCLQKAQGGRGVLLGGVPGVPPANVTVIGGGMVGESALKVAIGMGANVTVLDSYVPKLRELANRYPSLNTLFANDKNLYDCVTQSDLVIGAVLVPGDKAPKVVTIEMLKAMNQGSVLVDVAIDQGGCFETSRPTNFDSPTFVEEGVIHQCVTNLPGSVPRTSTFALNNVTMPFIIELANKGWKQACLDDKHLMNGLNISSGNLTCEAVSKALDIMYTDPGTTIN